MATEMWFCELNKEILYFWKGFIYFCVYTINVTIRGY